MSVSVPPPIDSLIVCVPELTEYCTDPARNIALPMAEPVAAPVPPVTVSLANVLAPEKLRVAPWRTKTAPPSPAPPPPVVELLLPPPKPPLEVSPAELPPAPPPNPPGPPTVVREPVAKPPPPPPPP